MKRVKIITNNPLVRAKYPELTVFSEVGAEGVLVEVRDLVHLGAVVLSHPLSGSILPGVSPYKSIIITDCDGNSPGGVDFESVSLIEKALELLKKPPDGFLGFDGKVLEDFQVIDLDLMDCAIISHSGGSNA